MRNQLLLLSTAVLMVACSSKEEQDFLKIYEKNLSYHNQLLKTEKVKLSDGNYSKALLTATYLYTKSEESNDTRDEKFVVGLYLDDEEGSFESGDYNLTLNGKGPKSFKTLRAGDPLLKTISFDSEWTTFYLFTFPHSAAKKFRLVFAHETYGKGELHFAKAAKYTFTKTPF